MDNEQQNETVEEVKTDNPGAENHESHEETKTFTQEEVDKIVQKRVGRALRDKEAEIEKAQTEAAKLAKMNTEQKQAYALEQAQKAREEAEAKLHRYEMKSEVQKQIAEKGITTQIPDTILSMVITDKAESTEENCQSMVDFLNAFAEDIRTGVLKGSTPRKNGEQATVAKNDFDRMTYVEKAKIYEENPELFKQLLGGK